LNDEATKTNAVLLVSSETNDAFGLKGPSEREKERVKRVQIALPFFGNDENFPTEKLRHKTRKRKKEELSSPVPALF
jgi:hypothetical protein|tara:strand:- start:478 stop:708 length:231 start_codon:yes stop_codon:yes gene_type:complete